MIIVNGPPGIGKTTLCRGLLKKTPNSIWLDGDWCWFMNPWIVNKETVQMVEDNIAFLLRSYLKSSNYEYIYFSWVLHREEITERLLNRLKDFSFKHRIFTLTANKESLRKRMVLDKRPEDNIKLALGRLVLYASHNSIKIDTSFLNPEETYSIVLKAIEEW